MININSKILFLIILAVSLTMLNANYNQSLILKKGSSEEIINPDDLILIKCKNKRYPDPKYLGGQFIGSENNFILFETKTLLGKKSLESVHLNDIEALYLGNVRTWSDLRQKWTLYLSLLIIPGSIQMGNSSNVTQGFEGLPASIISWSFFSMVSHITYAPIFASIDFNKRRKNATEFIIGKNEWTINLN